MRASVLAGSSAVPAACPAAPDMFKLQAHFWQLEAEHPFTPTETKLYFYWLHRFNHARWKPSLPRTVKQVSADLTLDDKTVDKARKGLESRGLLTYLPGTRGQSAFWFLGAVPTPTGPSAGVCSPTSWPPDERNFSGQVGGNPANSPQDERKISGPYKEENKTSSVVENQTRVEAATAAAHAENILGVPLCERKLPSADSYASAAHTGAGADLASPPAARGQVLPKLEDDPWRKVPRDVAMVEAYLQHIGSPHAGKGHLFFNYYASVGWVVGKNKFPSQNWQALIPSFKFLDHAPESTSFSPRPLAGQKPTGTAGQLARALAERRAGK